MPRAKKPPAAARGRKPLPVAAGSTGALIREARVKAELSQSQLAERIGGSTSMVSELERGARPAAIDTLRAIAAACGVADFRKLIGD